MRKAVLNLYIHRFLASGDSIVSMSYQYLVGVTTASNIIYEVCRAIWKNLQPTVLPAKYTSEKWLKIADEYDEMWNFVHCIGSLDGKHIVIQVFQSVFYAIIF